MGDGTLLLLLLGFGVVFKWAVQGAASNPSGTANFFRGFFK